MKRMFDDWDRDLHQRELTPQLLAAWRVRIRQWCARELGREFTARLDTSDVVQESLMQIWQDWDRFRGQSPGEMKSWLFRIARGHLHKARRHHRAEKRSVRHEAATIEVERTLTDQDDPLGRAVLAESRLNLMLALERLSPELEAVVRRRVFAQQNYREIGDALGLSKDEARNRFLRALRQLKANVAEIETHGAQAPA